MYSVSLIQYAVSLLRSDSVLRDALVVAAFPEAYKPSRVTQPIIAVSQGGLEAKNIEIGRTHLYGDITLQAEVFVPQRDGSPCLKSVADRVIYQFSSLNPRRIQAGKIGVRDDLGAYTVCCSAVLPYYELTIGD